MRLLLYCPPRSESIVVYVCRIKKNMRKNFTFLILLLSCGIIVSVVVFSTKTTSLSRDGMSTMSPQESSLEKVINTDAEEVVRSDGYPGYYESTEEIMARLKKDVIVTGTITGIPGEETALFKIEGMPDRSFGINTQLMDGFIITEITENAVVLKNQQGNEHFTIQVLPGAQ